MKEIAYTNLPKEKRHLHRYARSDGKRSNDQNLVTAGLWFPKTPAGRREPEPRYSGGLVLDHTVPAIAYLSRQVNGVFELEKWVTPDGGKNWESIPLTVNSALDNVRPVAVRNQKRGRWPTLLWMQIDRYVHYTDYKSAIKMNVPDPPSPGARDSGSVRRSRD